MQVYPILDNKFRWIYISEIIQEDLSLTILHATVTNVRKLAFRVKSQFIQTNLYHFQKVLHSNDFKKSPTPQSS